MSPEAELVVNMRMAALSPIGWRIWGIGILAVGLVSLGLGDFDPGQSAPKWLPGRTLLAYAANGFLVFAAVALQWRRASHLAAAALTLYYAVIVVVFMGGGVILAHPRVFGGYSGGAEQLAFATAGLIVWVNAGAQNGPGAALLTRVAQVAFGVCAVLFGFAHFFYLDLTTPLVPKWLPPSATFWAYATGIFHIAAGLAIITGIRARLAAVLLTIMYAAFTPLVHLPLLLGDLDKAFYWTENALNIALIGAAWVMADSLGGPSAHPHRPRRGLAEPAA